MAQFARYYLDFLITILKNIASFFVGIYEVFKKALFTDIGNYFKSLAAASKDFEPFDWIALIVVTIIGAALTFFIFYRLFQIIRRYVISRSKEVEKDQLSEEVARLKETAAKIAQEKSEIFALKLGVDYLNEEDRERALAEGEVIDDDGQVVEVVSRFTKLINIDKKYMADPAFISMNSSDLLPLDEIVDKFRNFAASQLRLYYTPFIVRQYFAAMATSKVIILEGVSGTGKTSLPYAMAKFFDNNASIVSVQPSWRDRNELVGYFNEFTKKFNETDFLASLYDCTYREDPNFIILDEMNLARIEYYFAEFLSIMEMPDTSEWKVELIAAANDTDPKHLVDGKIVIPQNIWFVGTANQDDSTFTITDKVYDRAVSISLNNKGAFFDAPLTENLKVTAEYMLSLFEQSRSMYKISDNGQGYIKEIDKFLQEKFRVAFGNRIIGQINKFVPAFIACGGTENEAIDFMLTTKILRKLNALNLAFLSKEIKELILIIEKCFGKGGAPLSSDFLKSLLRVQ